MLKTIVRHIIRDRNVKKYVFKSPSITKKQMTGLHYYGRNQLFSLRTNRTKEFMNNNKGLLNFYKMSKSITKEKRFFCNNENSSEIFWSGNFNPSTKLSKGSRLGAKKNLHIMVKRLWFFDTAAPIPGVSSLKKKKRLNSIK